MPRIVAISDTHNLHAQVKIPKCDILLHSGDITVSGKPRELEDFNEWCCSLLDQEIVGSIVVCAGNHDFTCESNDELARKILKDVIYLNEEAATVEGLRIWGCPWTPRFFDWAFNYDREKMHEHWAKVPSDVEILVTHGPPYGFGDETLRGEKVGDYSLTSLIKERRFLLTVHGHIHSGYGQYQYKETRIINASTCNEKYKPVNPPIVIDL